MAVKPTTTKSREPYFLELLENDANRPSRTPLLLHNLDDVDLGITLVGRQLRSDTRLNQVQARQIITDVIAAIAWLYQRGIIHRDICCENIILNYGRAVVIDYNCSYDLRWSVPTHFLGGYICIPPAHLPGICAGGGDYRYIPSRADDCFAIALLAYTILFPLRFANFRASEIETPGSLEGPEMIDFCKQLQSSPL